jgi:hypothetical protein
VGLVYSRISRIGIVIPKEHINMGIESLIGISGLLQAERWGQFAAQNWGQFGAENRGLLRKKYQKCVHLYNICRNKSDIS